MPFTSTWLRLDALVGEVVRGLAWPRSRTRCRRSRSRPARRPRRSCRSRSTIVATIRSALSITHFCARLRTRAAALEAVRLPLGLGGATARRHLGDRLGVEVRHGRDDLARGRVLDGDARSRRPPPPRRRHWSRVGAARPWPSALPFSFAVWPPRLLRPACAAAPGAPLRATFAAAPGAPLGPAFAPGRAQATRRPRASRCQPARSAGRRRRWERPRACPPRPSPR